MILNAIYLGLNHQMAATVETIPVSHNESTETEESFKPSDDVALHRICGWALKSTLDQEDRHILKTTSLKLTNTDKHLLFCTWIEED